MQDNDTMTINDNNTTIQSNTHSNNQYNDTQNTTLRSNANAEGHPNVNQSQMKNKRHFYINKRAKNRRIVNRNRGNSNSVANVYNVRLSQINLGRRIEAMSQLNQNNSQGHFLALLQEPHLRKKQGRATPSGLDSQHQVYHASDIEPRAAIYAHRELPIWLNRLARQNSD